jgi:hypothetical protein
MHVVIYIKALKLESPAAKICLFQHHARLRMVRSCSIAMQKTSALSSTHHGAQHLIFADDKQVYVSDACNEVNSLYRKLADCFSDASAWCPLRQLQLNSDKSEACDLVRLKGELKSSCVARTFSAAFTFSA